MKTHDKVFEIGANVMFYFANKAEGLPKGIIRLVGFLAGMLISCTVGALMAAPFLIVASMLALWDLSNKDSQ